MNRGGYQFVYLGALTSVILNIVEEQEHPLLLPL